MLNISTKLQKKPKSFHALTGMSADKFNDLLKKVKPLWQKAEFKRKHSLTMKEKEFNKALGSKRIIVEHVFTHLKKFHILQDRFRNNISKYNLIFKNVCGIRNMVMS